MNERHALVVGAGVAGCVAALALRRAGWTVEVLEGHAHEAGLRQGVFLTLAANGMDALEAVGAADAVAGLGFATGWMTFTNGAGRELGALPMNPPGARAITRTLRRADLYGALVERVRAAGIDVRDGRRVVAVDTTAERATATLDDGSELGAALLVGADGLRSVVRPAVDAAAPQPRPSGLGNLGGTARGLDLPADGDYRMVWGTRCFFGYTVAPDGEVWWFANPPADAGVRSAADLLPLLEGDAGPAAAIVAATDGPVFADAQWSLPRVPVWTRGRLVLAGDAAHAVSPASGQGASLAAEDGAVLGHALAGAATVAAGLADYVARRQARAERVRRWGERSGSAKLAGPVGRRVRDAVMPLGLRLAGAPRVQAKQAWLFDHHVPPLPQVTRERAVS